MMKKGNLVTPNKPESASFRRFRQLAKRVVAVPKSEVDKRTEERKASRASRKLAKE